MGTDVTTGDGEQPTKLLQRAAPLATSDKRENNKGLARLGFVGQAVMAKAHYRAAADQHRGRTTYVCVAHVDCVECQ